MKKVAMFLAFLLLTPVYLLAQDIFIDPTSGKEYLFLGSDNALTGQKKWLDIKENTIVWFDEDYLKEQSGVLTPEEFFQKTLGNGVVFLTSSETPYWEATISNNSIFINNMQGKKEETPIEFNYRSAPIDNAFFIMFHSKDRRIYGSIMKRPENSGCIFSLDEEGSVYEILVNFDGNTLKGCAILDKK